ncbi:hypothetical protein M885DRAFT_506262 [Pelagophyceae sp. CCMP2097]|nr:hypothetical protein M885DRAFT_506262 [Pelagophyceae sp. CCMP2097]
MSGVKAMLFKVLEDALGEFVVGFSPEHLKVGLWSGKIVLNDLEVNSAAVSRLGLPLGVKLGTVRQVSVKIPWTSLGSNPVQVMIDGVRIVAVLEKPPAEYDQAQLVALLEAQVRARLEAADSAYRRELDELEARGPGEAKPSTTMLARYATMIVDNLEVHVTDVDVKFEGAGLPTLGLSLAAFDAVAVDESWEPSFLQRDAAAPRPLLRNKVALRGFELTADGRDVLSKVDATLKLTRNEAREPGRPLYNVDLEGMALRWILRSSAVGGCAAAVRQITVCARQHVLAARHPCVRHAIGKHDTEATHVGGARPVTRRNASLWWRYAAEFVCEPFARGQAKRDRLDEESMRTLRQKERYMELFENQIRRLEAAEVLRLDDKAAKKGKTLKKPVDRSIALEAREMRAMELDAPLAAIVFWRRSTILKVREESALLEAIELAQQTSAQAAKKKPGKWGRLFGRGPAAAKSASFTLEGGDVSLAHLEARFASFEEDEPATDLELLRCAAHGSIRLRIVDDSNGVEKVLATLGVGMDVFTSARGDDVDVAVRVDDILLQDETGAAAQCGIRDGLLLRPAQAVDRLADHAFHARGSACAAAAALLPYHMAHRLAGAELLLAKRGETYAAELETLSYSFAYHAPLISKLVSVLSTLDAADAAALQRAADEARAFGQDYATRGASRAYAQLVAAKRGVAEVADEVPRFAVSVYMGSPILTLPRAYEADAGAFILALGAIDLTGAVKHDLARQTWRLTVDDARVSQHGPRTAKRDEPKDLVKPFQTCVALELNSPKHSAPVAVEVRVGPTLCLSASPQTTSDVLALVALLNAGNGNAPPAVIAAPADAARGTVALPGTAAPPPSAAPDDAVSVAVSVHIQQVQVVVLADSRWAPVVYRLTLDAMEADCAVSPAETRCDATLAALSLRHADATYIIESSSGEEAAKGAASARAAVAALPRHDDVSAAFGDGPRPAAADEALLSLSFSSWAGGAAARVALSRLRLRCGAQTLRPLKPMMRAILGRGAQASLVSSAVVASAAAAAAAAAALAAGAARAMRFEATLGEVEMIILADDGATSVVDAALLGAAVRCTLRGGASRMSVRVAELVLRDDAEDSAPARRQTMISEWAPRTGDAAANEALAAILKARGNGGAQLLVSFDQTDLVSDAGAKSSTIRCDLHPIRVLVLPSRIVEAFAAANGIAASLADLFLVEDAPAARAPVARGAVVAAVGFAVETLDVELRLCAAELSMVRDPDAAVDSQQDALAVRCGGVVRYKTSKTRGQHGSASLDAQLTDLGLYLDRVQGVDEERFTVLLQPVTATCNMERMLDASGFAIDTSMKLALSYVESRFSYQDLRAISCIAAAAALPPPPTLVEDDTTSFFSRAAADMRELAKVDAENADAVEHKVATLRLAATAAGARLTLDDDSVGPFVPAVQLRLGDVDAALSGPLSMLAGHVGMTFAADGFNRACLAYEPVVPKFKFDVDVEAAYKAAGTDLERVKVAVRSKDVLELRVTDAFVGSLARIVQRWTAADSLDQCAAAAPKAKVGPFAVTNSTELPLLCRSSTREAWLDLAPGATVEICESPDAKVLLPPQRVDVACEDADNELRQLVAGRPQRCIRQLGSARDDVVWRVGLDEASGRVLAQLHACARVDNATDLAFEIKAAKPGAGAGATVVAKPGQTPLLISQARKDSVLVFRPFGEAGVEAPWSPPQVLWPSAKKGSDGFLHRSASDSLADADERGGPKARLVVCEGAGGPTHVVVSSKPGPKREVALALAPPIEFCSKLPCGVVLTLVAQGHAKGAAFRVAVPPGGNASCCALDPAQGVWVACRVDRLTGGPAQPLTVPSANAPGLKKHEFSLTVDLRDRSKQDARTLKLDLKVERRHHGAGLRLTLSCPVWLVDETGLGLSFAHAPPSHFRPQRPRAASAPDDSRQSVAVDARILEDFGVSSIKVGSQRPHALKVGARPGDGAYAEPNSPYDFTKVPFDLQKACRLVTHDAERGGADARRQPEFFNRLGAATTNAFANTVLETPASRSRRAAQYITVEAGARGAVVVVAVDARARNPAPWLVDHFARDAAGPPLELTKRPANLLQRAEARPYDVWRCALKAHATVELGANAEDAMYLVFLTPLPQPDVTQGDAEAPVVDDGRLVVWDNSNWPGLEWLGDSHAGGDSKTKGVALLHSPLGHVALEVGGAWSQRLTVGAASFLAAIDGVGASTKAYELEVRPEPLGGAFAAHGNLVRVGPRFAVRNVDGEATVVLRQAGAGASTKLAPKMQRAEAWQWPQRDLERKVEFGVSTAGGVRWATTALPIDAIGGYALQVPSPDGNGLVVRVEIALSADVSLPPHSSIVVSACVDRLRESPLFVAHNGLQRTITLYQAQPDDKRASKAPAAAAAAHRLTRLAVVEPGASCVFGWARALAPKLLHVDLGFGLTTAVDADVVRVLNHVKPGSDIYSFVHVLDGTRVIEFTTQCDTVVAQQTTRQGPEITASLSLGGIGASLVAGKDELRREVVYARLNDVAVVLRRTNTTDELEASIASLQVDNHGPGALWPTFLSSAAADGGGDKVDKGADKVVSFVCVRERHSDDTTSLRYLALRVLPLDVRADLKTLLGLGEALQQLPLELLSGGYEAALAPAAWAARLSASDADAAPGCAGEYEAARALALRQRGFVDALVLHPMEFTISFEPTSAERDDVHVLSALAYVQRLAAIDSATIKLNSFLVERALESPAALVDRVVRHYAYSVVSQLHRIVGSLASFGAPANLVATIGGGVKEFFYAPAEGLLVSPKDFAKGLYKGTTGLVSSTVGGLTSSVAGVGNAVSTNVSMLSADKSFVADREARRRRFAAEGGGAAEGVLAGGEAIARGIGEGVAGIFLKPVQGAQREGAAGFFKGAAQGLLGVVVKPVVGVLDGGMNVLQGVSQQCNQRRVAQHVRPPLDVKQIPDSDSYILAEAMADTA